MKGPFGLRWSRLGEWVAVLRAERATIPWGAMLKLAFWYAVGRNRIDSKTALRRYRACNQCPIFDKNLLRCRPYTGSTVGCGCFAVYAIVTKKRCWLRERGIEFGGHGYD
jgi:hypothetical protein